ncbi:hypothetical protein LTR01_008299 [Friedmanniomyces endolithicus]|nr:hypothetical protein LTR01_008299 [Friedmanniomyces endolithicus]KAK0835517.1 ubiquitin-conjugating enzyme E2 S [Friedmanniomyces endolithicus]
MPGYISNVTSPSGRFHRLAEESEDWSVARHGKWRFQRANITQEVQLFLPANSRFAGQQINVKVYLTMPYPREPPAIRFLNPVPDHPHITRRGELAEQTWSPAWDPSMGVIDVLEQLMTWLDVPDSQRIGNVPAQASDHRSREESRTSPSEAERKSTVVQWENALPIVSGQGEAILQRQGVANPFLDPEGTASSAHDEDESSEPLIATSADAKPRPYEAGGRSPVRRGGEWLLKGAKRFGQSFPGRSEHRSAQVVLPRGREYPW